VTDPAALHARRRWPAEWEPQDAVLLTWPHDQSDWAANLAATEASFVAIARAVTAHEDLLVACRDAAHRGHVAAQLQHAGIPAARTHLWIAPSNDSWARDHGPVTVLDAGKPTLLDFRFNGWGGKYAADLDDRITARLHGDGAFGATRLESVPLVLEGGAIESDGAGTLLATHACVVSPSRNPGLGPSQVESVISHALNLHRVLWLEHGALEGDDTDGHVDTLARFCDAATIAYTACDDAHDSHHAPLADMARELRALRRVDGAPYRLVPLPLPAAIRNAAGDRLPATYANFLIINDAVLVPVYADPADRVALERLTQCFPGRRIVAVDCRALIAQYGSLHCVTMQLPAGVLARRAADPGR